jgi:hypothetical protein
LARSYNREQGNVTSKNEFASDWRHGDAGDEGNRINRIERRRGKGAEN